MRIWGIIATCAIAVLFVVAFVVPAVLRGCERTDGHSACVGNMHHLWMAMRMYAMDHDGRLPEANRWVDALTPRYIESVEAFKCFRDKSPARCSYGMNIALSGRKLSEITDESSVVLLYETAHPGDNPCGGAEDVVSPPRHRDGNPYLFLDGPVRKSE